MNDPITVSITGAAGQIGYSLLFRIASGDLFGSQQPVNLRLIEIEPALNALKGTAMELEDCAFPLLHSVTATSELDRGFSGAHWALLVGSVPRKAGMERNDLLAINGEIFISQGQSIAKNADPRVRTVVVGNPCNTNALIAMSHAQGIPNNQFFAMTRLDENRAKAQLAHKAGVHTSEVSNMAIWGNHSATQYPDFTNALINGQPVSDVITDSRWLKTDFISTVQQRGASIIQQRGASSAASAANALIDTVKSLSTPTPQGDWTSVCVPSDGSYGIDKGLIASFPVRTEDGQSWSIVPDLPIDSFSEEQIAHSVQELRTEKEAVSHLLPS